MGGRSGFALFQTKSCQFRISFLDSDSSQIPDISLEKTSSLPKWPKKVMTKPAEKGHDMCSGALPRSFRDSNPTHTVQKKRTSFQKNKARVLERRLSGLSSFSCGFTQPRALQTSNSGGPDSLRPGACARGAPPEPRFATFHTCHV